MRLQNIVCVGLAAAALASTGCATTSSVVAEKPRESAEKNTVTQAPKTPEEMVTPRAKLMFDDAVKALGEQRAGKQITNATLVSKFKAAADADPNFAEPLYNLGVLAEKEGNTQAAASYYKQALAKKPSLHQAAANLAVIAEKSGNEAGAVEMYTRLKETYDEDSVSRARLADVYRKRGECGKASELAKEALFRDPKSLSALKVLMACYQIEKQNSLARLVGLRASRIDPNDPDVHYVLAMIALDEKRKDVELSELKKALAAKPDHLASLREVAILSLKNEDYSAAEQSIRKLLQHDGKSAELHVNLGVAYKGLGQFDKALKAYDDAERINADLPAIYLNRGLVLATQQQPEKAIEQLKKYIQLKGEGALDPSHAVFETMKSQEKIIERKESDKRAMEEAKKMEEEAKKQDDAKKEEERKKKEEEFKAQQQKARGNAAEDAAKPAAPAKKKAGSAAPAPAPEKEKKEPNDEPTL